MGFLLAQSHCVSFCRLCPGRVLAWDARQFCYAGYGMQPSSSRNFCLTGPQPNAWPRRHASPGTGMRFVL